MRSGSMKLMSQTCVIETNLETTFAATADATAEKDDAHAHKGQSTQNDCVCATCEHKKWNRNIFSTN